MAHHHGLRKNDREVAAIHFTALPNSYTARTGRPDNVGVIGVALYWEKPVPQITRPWREAPPIAEEAGREGTWRQDRVANGAATESMQRAPAPASKSALPAGPLQDGERLGTGHGPDACGGLGARTGGALLASHGSRCRLVRQGRQKRCHPCPTGRPWCAGPADIRYSLIAFFVTMCLQRKAAQRIPFNNTKFWPCPTIFRQHRLAAAARGPVSCHHPNRCPFPCLPRAVSKTGAKPPPNPSRVAI